MVGKKYKLTVMVIAKFSNYIPAHPSSNADMKDTVQSWAAMANPSPLSRALSNASLKLSRVLDRRCPSIA